MRTVTVTGDALTLEDLVAVARGRLGGARHRRGGPDGAQPGGRGRRRRAGPGDVRRDDRFRRAGRHPCRPRPTSSGCSSPWSGRTAAGVGEPLPDDVVRGLLLLRARTLAAGYSGVRADLPRRLLELLDRGLLPVIPGKGSVGASGDLAQLAHLAQPLVGEGRLRRAGDRDLDGRPSAELLAEEGLEPLTLAAKEGLSPDQRHRADAGAARAGGRRDRAAGQGGRHRLRDERRVAARHRPAVRRAGAGDPARTPASSPARQPAAAARRLPAGRQPPGERPRRAGLLLPALRAAGARRGARRALPRPPGHRHRARLDRRQPGDRARTARSCRPATSTASRSRSPATCSRSRSPSSPASRSGAPTGCSTRRSPATCRHSSPGTRAPTRAT